MPAHNSGNAVSVVSKIAEAVAAELKLEIWDVEFVKEGSTWYLRIYIDKDTGITLDDCEAFHRRIDPLIDEADPIEQSYFLEVSSPGIERLLKKPKHFEKMTGQKIRIRFFRADSGGNKETVYILNGYKNGEISVIADGNEKIINIKDTVFVKIYDDFGGND